MCETCYKEIVVRSVYCTESHIIVGTHASDIIQIDAKNNAKIDFVCKGHAEGELWSLATSPANTDLFATASDDHTLR